MTRRDKQRIDLFLVVTAWNNDRRRQVMLSKIYNRHDLAYWRAKAHVDNATVNVNECFCEVTEQGRSACSQG